MSADPSDTLSSVHDSLEGRTPPDPALVREFERAIVSHRGRMFAVCNRIVRNDQLAEEITNEALLIAYRKLATFERRGSLSTWLCGIAKHLAMNAVRKKGELLTEDGVVESEDPARGPLRSLSSAERRRVVLDALSELPSQEQDIVFLRYIENLPHEAIEGALGLDDSVSVRAVLQRAKNHLRKKVSARLEQMGHGLSFVGTRE